MKTRRLIIASAVLTGLALTGLANVARAAMVELDLQTSNPVMKAGEKQTAYLRVAIKGLEPPETTERAPVNLAIVLDKSGSMKALGKIAEAREAAIRALDLLGPRDIVSVVTYDSTVQVIVPATRIRDREELYQRIRGIQPSGSTALFAGVSRGADELRKFAGDEIVSRVLLLSDGLANVGPQSPGDLADLGGSLGREGFGVSTIGLGLNYNEDLMARLAANSDGNHYFVEVAADLPRIFERELGRMQKVVAQDLRIDVHCAEGVRPVRVLGREAEIANGHVRVDLNELYGLSEREVVLEIEVPAEETGASRELANVDLRYRNVIADREDSARTAVLATFSDSEAAVDRAVNEVVMVPVVDMIAAEVSQQAILLHEQGRIEESRALFRSNYNYIDDNMARYTNNARLIDGLGVNDIPDAQGGTDVLRDLPTWRRKRKELIEYQNNSFINKVIPVQEEAQSK